MRQLTLTEERTVEWRDAPDPVLRDANDVIVRPLAVALCDIDQPMIRGAAPMPAPIALGHEFVAEIVQAGDMVERQPGARVVVPFQISCGECERCIRGLTGDCLTVPRLSAFGFGQFGGEWGGALSDLVRVPFADHMLVEVPPGVQPATVASASDNIPDGWRTVAGPLERRPEAPVLVIGGASIGLYAVDAALALGAERVTYVDSDHDRLQVAKTLGAHAEEGVPGDHVLHHHPITVDAGQTHDSLVAALRATEPSGECTSTGILFEPQTALPLLEMYTNGVTFHIGRAQARPVIPRILELVAAGRLRPGLVTSRVVGWEEAPEAVMAPERKLVIERPAARR
jgi:threonine dehydrogenase-like Zn-dependent dehydrogenase